MNEEKTMILNMLKEGKISVEEAEKLLDAVGSEEQTTETKKDELKLDFEDMKAGLKDGFKDFAKSMEGTFKSAMEGLKSLDLSNVITDAFGTAKGTAEKELILSADQIDALNLKVASGDIVVTGDDTGDVLIRADITTRGSDEESAKDRAEKMELVHDVENGVLNVRDSGSKMNVTGPYSIDYQIAVPESLNVNLQTMDGDVTVKATGGAVKVSNYSGDVHIRDCSGALKVNSKSGDIVLNQCAGAANISTLSGDLTLDELSGPEIQCNTLSGDISGVLRTPAAAKVKAKTLSGDIDLMIPADSGFSINADTLSGDVSCDLPVQDVEKKGHRYAARLGDADGEMVLATKSGDINLSAADVPDENIEAELIE